VAAYYNEINPYAAEWLRNLIKAGHIAPGEVDGRSIEDVKVDELASFTQCHFFAGIGVWSHALRSAGWTDDRPVWTGSCPCQPFSGAGKRLGFADERHLWPVWFRLISERRPSVIFGEQVASADALAWLDVVQSDLERADYAVGAFDLCAAGFGAPHLRQRLWWVADSDRERRDGIDPLLRENARSKILEVARSGSVGDGYVVEPDRGGRGPERERRLGRGMGQGPDTVLSTTAEDAGEVDSAGIVVDSDVTRLEGRSERRDGADQRTSGPSSVDGPGPTNGFWGDAEWLYCRDEKYRAAEPGTFPLAYGPSSRVGKLRAYGNAIVAPVASEVIRAYMETRP